MKTIKHTALTHIKPAVLCVFALILILLAIHDATLSRGRQSGTVCPNCNVVLIDIDTLRADDLPCYGYKRNTAPELCAFAAKSALFKQNYTQAHWTLPSLFSTITSVYPWEHRVYTEFDDRLSPTIPTLAQILQSAGYRTLYVGQTGPYSISKENGGTRGYDSIIDSQNWLQELKKINKSSAPFFIQFYSAYLHLPYLLDPGVSPMVNMVKPDGFPLNEEAYHKELAEYLRTNYQDIFSRDSIKTHKDLFTSTGPDNDKKLLSLFFSLDSVPDKNGILRSWSAYYHSYLQHIDPKNPEHRAYLRLMYDTKIHTLDKKLSSFFAYLLTPGVARKTIVILMSDHGENFGEHGGFSHDPSPYTELYYTPLIVRVPEAKPTSFTGVSRNIDILPTILDATGLQPDPLARGNSLLPEIYGKSDVSLYAAGETLHYYRIENGRWLYIEPDTVSTGSAELYDKLSDPKELHNLINKSAGVSNFYAEQLRAILQTARLAIPNNSVSPSWMAPSTKERLTREGYF
ncbi:sulfatase [Patescibacteria group bacterium]|nr:sulfatase [Patescibacteria group bacterium]